MSHHNEVIADRRAPRAATGKRSYRHLVGADGSAKAVVRKGDAVIDAATLGARKGKRMRVAQGRHAGMECIVREVDAGGEEGATALCLCMPVIARSQLRAYAEHAAGTMAM